MPITIGPNIAALKAKRQLDQSSGVLSGVYERLSSGSRINKASDDAAGLAIADSLRANARLYTVATRNIQDGISATTIAGAALESQQGILVRLEELAEKSANGVYSSTQRLALNEEYQSLVEEFGRIAATTTFNWKKLLLGNRSGNSGEINLQAGINGSVQSALSLALQDSGSYSGQAVVFSDVDGDGAVTGSDYGLFDTYLGGGVFATGVTFDFDNIARLGGASLNRQTVKASNGEDVNVYMLFTTYASASFNPDAVFVFQEIAPGRLQSVDLINLDSSSGYNGSVDLAAGQTANLNVDYSTLNFQDAVGDTDSYQWILDNSHLIGATPGDFSPAVAAIIPRKSALEFTGIETAYRARDALDVTKNRSEDLSAIQGALGAFQSRLSSSFNVVSSAGENFLSAESRIRDTDIAADSAELVRTKILQQASTAVLANANLIPQLALQLLAT